MWLLPHVVTATFGYCCMWILLHVLVDAVAYCCYCHMLLLPIFSQRYPKLCVCLVLLICPKCKHSTLFLQSYPLWQHSYYITTFEALLVYILQSVLQSLLARWKVHQNRHISQQITEYTWQMCTTYHVLAVYTNFIAWPFCITLATKYSKWKTC